MPITQDRMLALVAAAEDYEQAWTKVRSAYSSIAQNLSSGKITLQEAWAELDFMFTSQLFLSDPENTFKSIARETAHFKASSKRNIKSAQWQREKRGGRPARTPAEVQARIAQSNLKRNLAQFSNGQPQTKDQPQTKPAEALESEKLKPVLKITNTDGAQISADSELDFEPGEISDSAKQQANSFIDDIAAKEAYEQKYGNKPVKQSNDTVGELDINTD